MTLGPQFRTVYHSSYNRTPPHLVTDVWPTDDSGTELDVGATYNKEVLFAGGLDAAQDIKLADRRWLHSYRVPEDAIAPEMYGDDMMPHLDAEDMKPRRKRDETPTLWESLPVEPREAMGRGKVLQYRNLFEGAHEVDPESEDYLEDPVPSVVIPLRHMKKLGIQYMGVEDQK